MQNANMPIRVGIVGAGANTRDKHILCHSVTIPDHLIAVADMACGAQATFVISSVYGHVQANDISLAWQRHSEFDVKRYEVALWELTSSAQCVQS